MRKTIEFFAAGNDLGPVLLAIEERFSIRYVECGLFTERAEVYFNAWPELPDFGISISGDANFEPDYLMMPRNAPVAIREIAQKKGGSRFAIDQAANPESVVIRAGGFHHESGALIAGRFGTISGSRFSTELFGFGAAEIKKRFTKIQSYRVGNEAAELLDRGVRLTSSIKSPVLNDLKK